MSQTTNQPFRITVPITRCYLRKNADGVEKYVLEGMASNTNLDLTGEQMAESAIQSMAKSLETHRVYLNNEHSPDWDSDYGEIVKLWETPTHELMMEAELDPDHYRTRTLVKALEKGKQLGLSIEGYVQDWAMEYVNDLKRMVKTYKDILMTKISTTGTPAVADTWLTNISKSVKWSEAPMPKEEQVVKTEEEVEEVTTIGEAPIEAAPVEAQPSAEETPEAPQEEPTEPFTEESAQDEDQPVEPVAPAQEDEQPAPDGDEATKSAPEPADDDTSQVAKAAILGSYAEADVVWETISTLCWNLQWFIWDVMTDSDTSADEKTSLITAALTEYQQIVLNVATAMIGNGIEAETAKAVEALRENSPDNVSKSLTEKDANLEELKKSLAGKQEELEQVQKSLQKTQDELELTKARKVHAVVDKFHGPEDEQIDAKSVQKAAQAQFAGFISTGAR